MARASTPTLLTLNQYAEILGINPWHFNQAACDIYPSDAKCHSVVLQYAWSANECASREEIASAISMAEERIAQFLGFYPAPKWFEDERHPYPRQRVLIVGQTLGSMVGVRPYYGYAFAPPAETDYVKTVQLDWQFLHSAGKRLAELVEDNVAVTLSDADGDGFDELATVAPSVALPTGTLVEEVFVFPAGAAPVDENRIGSLRVDISGATPVITGWSAYFVDPEQQVGPRELDAEDPDIYLDAVDVYRVYTCNEDDAYAPAVFAWQRVTEASSYVIDYGTIQFLDREAAIVSPRLAEWDDSTGKWVAETFVAGDEPHLVSVNYRAGWPLNRWGHMAPPLDRAVAALATAYLLRPICGCGAAETRANAWQESALDEGTSRSFSGSLAQINCPFGPQRGAWEAYRIIGQAFASLDAVGL